MLAIVISNLIWILPLCIGFGLAGYAIRSVVLKKLRSRIQELEAEMLQNHAEILALQKENTELADKLRNNAVPVIPITGTPKENPGDNLPDAATRKKLLSTSNKKGH
jgi:hypothetical protein